MALVFGSAEANAIQQMNKALPEAAKEWTRYARAVARAKKNPNDTEAELEVSDFVWKWEAAGLTPLDVWKYRQMIREQAGVQLALFK